MPRYDGVNKQLRQGDCCVAREPTRSITWDGWGLPKWGRLLARFSLRGTAYGPLVAKERSPP